MFSYRIASVALAGALAVTALATPAKADDDHRHWRHHGDWHAEAPPPPPTYFPPPHRIYYPPPVVYAPPPPPPPAFGFFYR